MIKLRELFPNRGVDRKERIKRTIDFLFDCYNNEAELPKKLNEFVSSFNNIDEQEFADILVTAKFMELNNEDYND